MRGRRAQGRADPAARRLRAAQHPAWVRLLPHGSGQPREEGMEPNVWGVRSSGSFLRQPDLPCPQSYLFTVGKAAWIWGQAGSRAAPACSTSPRGKQGRALPAPDRSSWLAGSRAVSRGRLQHLCSGLSGQRLTVRMPELHPVLGHVSFPRRRRSLAYCRPPGPREAGRHSGRWRPGGVTATCLEAAPLRTVRGRGWGRGAARGTTRCPHRTLRDAALPVS